MVNLLILILAKQRQLTTVFRRIRLKLIGLKIKEGGYIGKVYCEWPNKIFIGENCTIQDRVEFRIGHHFLESNYIKIGNRCFIGNGCEFNCSSKIVIGDDCSIASNTTIVDVGHEFHREKRINQQSVVSKEIIIGNDVWVGTGCKILQGITIGDGVVIGAGSIVNRSIPPYQIWCGSPAKYIGDRN